MQKQTYSEINEQIKNNTESFVDRTESRFDSDVTEVVNCFAENRDYDIVLLAGPSSSGKTTTAEKFTQKINAHGMQAYRVSLDDFYLNRDDIPMTDKGVRDYENITALDIELINKTFCDLIEKREADLPLFDFHTGTRKEEKHHLRLNPDDILVVEGIHALNPIITEGLDPEHIFRTYISVSSRIFDDDGKVVFNKRNLRLIRRMIRDEHHRNSSVEDTLRQWPEVLKGEDKYIFPYEKYADKKIDSFHAYESCLFKERAIPLLDTVSQDSEYYPKAQELRSCLMNFEAVEEKVLPDSSLLMEFMR